MRRLVVLALATALVASACTSGKPPSPTLPSRASVQPGPEAFTVSVDGRSDAFPLAANAYFPHALKVHPGDVIRFGEVFSGEAHTVTFGTLVDRAAGSSPSPTPTATGTPAASALPGIYPQGRGQGRGDLVQAAVQPCFLGLGTPPTTGACPKVDQPPLSGEQAFYNSGWLSQGTTFTVTVSPTIGPATYHFQCLVHPDMTGTVEVVPPVQTIPSPAKVAAEGADQLAKVVQSLTPAARDAAAVTTTNVAGITQEGVTNALVTTFGPPEVDIGVSQTVSWVLYGSHAIALNPPDNAVGLLAKGSDGAVHRNAAAVNRVGGQAPPSGTPAKPVTVSGGSYGGSGFHNSGLLVSTPPGLITYTLQFSAPGTYTVRCLIHPAMMGTVKVF